MWSSRIGNSNFEHRLPVTDYLLTNCVALFFFLMCQSSLAQSGGSIHSSEAVEVGGIKQWINVKATNNSHPVLLFLHGGPGNSAMSYADKFTGELQKHFVVVQWDQRESGKTAELNTSDKPLTVSLMESDAVDLINYLRDRFSQDKIYLMGHSWGGFLGLKIAADHPELLNGYFAISPMVNQIRSEQLSLEWMITLARKNSNQEALNDLARVSVPFQNSEQLYFHRSWLAKLKGNKPPARNFVDDWGKKWLTLFNQACAVNFFVYAPELKCPVYFFVGQNDYQTYYKLTEDYYTMLKADKKRLFWFTDSGHNPHLTEPAKLQQLIVTEMNK